MSIANGWRGIASAGLEQDVDRYPALRELLGDGEAASSAMTTAGWSNTAALARRAAMA